MGQASTRQKKQKRQVPWIMGNPARLQDGNGVTSQGRGWWEPLEASVVRVSTVRFTLGNNLVAAEARAGAGAGISPGLVFYNLSRVSIPPKPGG